MERQKESRVKAEAATPAVLGGRETGELKKRCQELENNWKRAAADYQNLEKRTAKENEEFRKFANAALILKILPVLDGLERAAPPQADEGVRLVLKRLLEVLAGEGVEEIEALGKDFDPHRHDCLEVVKGSEEGKVVEVLARGYKIGERIIRPARVRVAKNSSNLP